RGGIESGSGAAIRSSGAGTALSSQTPAPGGPRRRRRWPDGRGAVAEERREGEGLVRELLGHRIHALRARFFPELRSEERRDFRRPGGDGPEGPGGDKGEPIGQGDVIGIDRGHFQDLAVLADREDRALASQALGNQLAEGARDRLAPPEGRLLGGTCVRRTR